MYLCNKTIWQKCHIALLWWCLTLDNISRYGDVGFYDGNIDIVIKSHYPSSFACLPDVIRNGISLFIYLYREYSTILFYNCGINVTRDNLAASPIVVMWWALVGPDDAWCPHIWLCGEAYSEGGVLLCGCTIMQCWVDCCTALSSQLSAADQAESHNGLLGM